VVVACVPAPPLNGAAGGATGGTIPVTDVGSEVAVVTIWPSGEAIVVVIGWTVGARPCNAEGAPCNRVATGCGAGFDTVVGLEAGVALSGVTTGASNAIGACAVPGTAPITGAPPDTLDPGGVDAPAGWANKAERATTVRNAPTRPSTSAKGPGHQRDRTGSSVWSSWSCPTVLPRFAP
jgi:hypothetical protein